MTFDRVLKAARLPHHPKRLVDIGVRDAASRPLRHRCRTPARSSQSTVDWWCPALSKPVFTSTNPAASTAAAATRVASGRRSLKPRAPSAPSPRRTSPRARRRLDRAIENGTMHRRSHVEVDPRLGLQGFGPCANSRAATPGPTAAAAKLMNFADYGLAVGNAADLLVLPCRSPAAAVSELCAPSLEFKRGRKSFSRPAAHLNRPSPSAPAGAGDTRATTQ
jgi:hypothetical protein